MKTVDVVSIFAAREPSFVLIVMLPSSIFSMAVSYTHLRAHET